MEIYIVLCGPRQDYLFLPVSTLGYKGGYRGDGSAAMLVLGTGEITAVAVLFRSIPCARAPPHRKNIVPEIVVIARISGKVIHIDKHKNCNHYERLYYEI